MSFPLPRFSHEWKSNPRAFLSGAIFSNEPCVTFIESNCETSVRPTDARIFQLR
jgi:hypothetical protein